jgi:hypothetical protein
MALPTRLPSNSPRKPELRSSAEDADRIGVALTVAEREQVLRGLDDPRSGLTELRSVLLREHEWRVREGLV